MIGYRYANIDVLGCFNARDLETWNIDVQGY